MVRTDNGKERDLGGDSYLKLEPTHHIDTARIGGQPGLRSETPLEGYSVLLSHESFMCKTEIKHFRVPFSNASLTTSRVTLPSDKRRGRIGLATVRHVRANSRKSKHVVGRFTREWCPHTSAGIRKLLPCHLSHKSHLAICRRKTVSLVDHAISE